MGVTLSNIPTAPLSLEAIANRLAGIEAALNNPPVKERNSEGWGFAILAVLTTFALWQGLIDPDLWLYVLSGGTAAYGALRTIKKTKEGNGNVVAK